MSQSSATSHGLKLAEELKQRKTTDLATTRKQSQVPDAELVIACF